MQTTREEQKCDASPSKLPHSTDSKRKVQSAPTLQPSLTGILQESDKAKPHKLWYRPAITLLSFLTPIETITVMPRLNKNSNQLLQLESIWMYILGHHFPLISQRLETMGAKLTYQTLYRREWGNVILQRRIGYSFRDPTLLEEALTRKSAVAAGTSLSLRHAERFEFLGDRVMGLVVSKRLFRHSEHHSPGQMSDSFVQHTRNSYLSAVATRLGLGQFVRVGGGEETRAPDNHTDKLLADILEALVGAVYVDAGEDMRTVEKVVSSATWFPNGSLVSSDKKIAHADAKTLSTGSIASGFETELHRFGTQRQMDHQSHQSPPNSSQRYAATRRHAATHLGPSKPSSKRRRGIDRFTDEKLWKTVSNRDARSIMNFVNAYKAGSTLDFTPGGLSSVQRHFVAQFCMARGVLTQSRGSKTLRQMTLEIPQPESPMYRRPTTSSNPETALSSAMVVHSFGRGQGERAQGEGGQVEIRKKTRYARSEERHAVQWKDKRLALTPLQLGGNESDE